MRSDKIAKMVLSSSQKSMNSYRQICFRWEDFFTFLCLEEVTNYSICHEWWTLKGKGTYVYTIETDVILVLFQEKSSILLSYTSYTFWGNIDFIWILFYYFSIKISSWYCAAVDVKPTSVIVFPLFHLSVYHKYLWRESQRTPDVNPIYLIKSNLEELFLNVWLFWTLSNERNKLC